MFGGGGRYTPLVHKTIGQDLSVQVVVMTMTIKRIHAHALHHNAYLPKGFILCGGGG